MSKEKVLIDAHPTDTSVIIKILKSPLRAKPKQLTINLYNLNSESDIRVIAREVHEKCPEVPRQFRPDIEHTIKYLQHRKTNNQRARRDSSLSRESCPVPLSANINKLDEYLEMLYEETPEKTKSTTLIVELAMDSSNLKVIAENETVVGALARIFREDWKKSFDLATNILKIFQKFAVQSQYLHLITQHKMGALCMTAIEHELKRGELWAEEAAKDTLSSKKYKIAIRKQQAMIATAIIILSIIAEDLVVQQKMIKRGIVQLLIKCLSFKDSAQVLVATLQLLVRLSIFAENRVDLEPNVVLDKIVNLVTHTDEEVQRQAVRLLYNLSFVDKCRLRMIQTGLVTHVAPLVQMDVNALHLLYHLSINDDAKAMLTYTDAIQILMSDVLGKTASDATKALLINACVEKRNAQLVCGARGEGLDFLMEIIMDTKDILLLKIVRGISSHTGPSQEQFERWVPQFVDMMKKGASSSDTAKQCFALEAAGVLATNTVINWAKAIQDHDLVPWMVDILSEETVEIQPLQLQIVIMCGSMATQLEAARLLVPLLDISFKLLHIIQNDDEFVIQLLYVFLQLIRHKELSDRLMGSDSVLGDYIIDLMHDKNEAIRDLCERALVIIGEHSIEWARKIATQRFRWHNAQWLETVENGSVDKISGQFDDDEWNTQVIFDDNFTDTEEQERLF